MTADRLLTPSKITAWLDCAHYLTLTRPGGRRRDGAPTNTFGSFARLLVDKGRQHEVECLQAYDQRGQDDLGSRRRGTGRAFHEWVDRVGNPLTRAGMSSIRCPSSTTVDRGVADFLVRVDDEDTGEVSYEPVDAKLSRAEAKPVMCCSCASTPTPLRRCGVRPRHMHLWLGSGRVGDTVRRGVSLLLESATGAAHAHARGGSDERDDGPGTE